MNKSTIPYSIVEERRRLNKCIENAPNECEREIYRKIRDMKIPYDKLDTILETSKELIKKKEKQRKKRMLFLINVSGFAAGICIFTQTSHIKKWVRSLKINTLAHKIAVTQPFVHVIMLPAYILADAEQSWL